MVDKAADARILVVDDEAPLREMLSDTLHIANYEVLEAADANEALTLLRRHTVDLIISDVNMPGMDGYELLARIRESGNNTPAIMLTARRERQDVTKGLKLGADDYVTKPFGLEELLLRVAAVLRRTKPIENLKALTCGPISLIDESHTVTVNDEKVELSPTEFDLLRILMQEKGKVLSRSRLLRDVWGINFDTGTNVVDTYISYLRRKVHTDDFQGIKTVRGVGFQMLDK
jgi:two-component system OmpR family response regulator